MNAQQVVNKLEWAEVDASLAPDCRRVMRDERQTLVVAMRSGDGARIKRALDEAVRVARLWGVL